jgi:nicotinate-nucleotide pyrophosphorylase (carboxylating)
VSLGNIRDLSRIVRASLKEDIGKFDITTRLVIPADKKIKAAIKAKQEGVLCGLSIAGSVFKAIEKSIGFRPLACDGEKIKKGQVLAMVYGHAAKILTGERVALNFLSMLSGIATKTRACVEVAKPYKVKILDTRKTLPGLRSLEKYAVRVGGGHNHRLRLDEMVLIKDNHFKVAGDKLWVMGLKAKRNKIPPKMKIEVEVGTLRELRQALEIRPDIIMLDNMSMEDVKKAVKIRNTLSPTTYNLLPKLEVSGNITIANIKKYARCGIDFISMGSLTKDVNSLDVSLDIL